MEPNVTNPQNSATGSKKPDMTNTVSDLHNEGVDIVDQGASEPESVTTSQNGGEQERVEETLDVDAESLQEPDLPRKEAQNPSPSKETFTKQPAQAVSPAMPKTALQQEMQAAWGDSFGTEPVVKPNVQNDPSIKPLRTFKSDAEEAVRYQNISAAQIAIAEQKKKLAATPIERSSDEERKSPLGIIAIVFMILLIAAGGSYYWFFVARQNPASSLPQELRVSTLVPYTKANTVTIGEGNIMDTIGGAIRATELDERAIYAVFPVPQGTTTNVASIASVLRDTKAPNMLTRSLAPQYMIGAYNNTTKDPFIILKNTYFQNAFAGMLEWEKDLRNDLISLIRVSRPQDEITLVNRDVFEDTVLSNIDARVLKDEEGNILIAYAFADKDTIVIATTIETLKTMLDKLLAVRIVQ